MFGVTKGEIVDSDGRTTGEIDAVVYDQSTAACLSVTGVRRIVKVVHCLRQDLIDLFGTQSSALE